jgi:hypothetical protein
MARQQHRQPAVHPRQRIGVSDQVGAEHNSLKCAVVDVAGLKRVPYLRQPVSHRYCITQIARTHCHTAPQRGRYLCGDRLPGIHCPVLPLPGLATAQDE